MENVSDVAFMFDTDALVQVFLTSQHNLLNLLNRDFGVSCFIMMEVEVELRSKPKFSGLIKPQLEKALKSGWLKILSSSDLDNLPCLQRSTLVTLAEIRQLGAEYELVVQRGEAYTHAAAVLLDVPSVSNDANAIQVLEAQGKLLPLSVLRSFDLFAFFHIEKYLDKQAVEGIRTTLRDYSEWIPNAMKTTSFVDGVQKFGCRLSTGIVSSSHKGNWRQPFYLQRR